MTDLAVPKVSQLTTITSDGKPSENAQFDCVEASVGAGILCYEGKSQWDSTINPDLLKDDAYGEAYRNDGTDAARLVPIVAKMGYKLFAVDGNQVQLVQKIHSYIQAGCPVIGTEPDPYSRTPGWSHCICFKGERPGYLTCLDPYIAEYIERPDQQWENLLLFGQIWVLQNDGGIELLQLSDPMGKHFVADGDAWKCPKTGCTLAFGHLTFYRQYGGIFGLPLTNEIYLASLKGTAIVVYERAIAIYDPEHVNDNPPGSGTVYLMHITGGIGQQIIAKPLIAALNEQISQLQAKAANMPDASELATYQNQIASYQAAFKQVSAIVSQMEGKTV